MSTASVNCPICGLGQPHGHDPKDLHVEQVIRPAFERMILARLNTSSLKLSGSGLSYAPCNSYVSYPFAFGWNKLPSQKNFGGEDAYDVTHWAHRSGFDQPYSNEQTELLWSVFTGALQLNAANIWRY
jgi:hypothetical protein